jgi:hypothetical protein
MMRSGGRPAGCIAATAGAGVWPDLPARTLYLRPL